MNNLEATSQFEPIETGSESDTSNILSKTAANNSAVSRATTASESRLSMKQVHNIVSEFYGAKPWIYWTDFLLSFGVALSAFMLTPRLPLFSLLQFATYAVSVILFYRSALFIHEIVHFPLDRMPAFRVVWNLLCGIPFLIPTFTYYTHLDHHVRRHFATHHDGEYLPLASRDYRLWLYYFAQPFVMPILAISRFMFLSPLTWISTAVYRFTVSRATSMVIDMQYVRQLPNEHDYRILRWQEAACFTMCWSVAMWLLFVNLDPITIWSVLQTYLTSVGVLMLNHVRTLGAHRYTNLERREVSFEEQVLDSVNYPNSWLIELAMPVGLRYHALHHLCPGLPYHNLGKAHRKLMQELPPDSIYRETNSPSLWSHVRKLLGGV